MLLTGDFIFLWTGKKKMRGVFEALVTENKTSLDSKAPHTS